MIFRNLNYGKKIVYLDSKINLTIKNTTNQIIKLIKKHPNKSIIIRKHHKNGRVIESEIKDACKHERYKKNMHLTKTYIEENNINYSYPIFLTGVIIYNNIDNVLNAVREVYNLCMEHNQPQCQIYFSAKFNTKKYKKVITSRKIKFKTSR